MDAVTGADLERFRELTKLAAAAEAKAQAHYDEWAKLNSEASKAARELTEFVAELAERTS